MRHGSLFSGIGGFDLAAEWMGWENIFHCEWNSFGKKILNHYWPNSISYDDITKTDFTIHRGEIDILTGGFPCQPYSLAGKRLGKEDERHLWPEMLRAIREIQPRWVVGENVYGLVNWSDGLVFHEVQSDLEAEGYQVFPYVLPAASVNAPHKRDRIWFVAHARNNGNATDTISDANGLPTKRGMEMDGELLERPIRKETTDRFDNNCKNFSEFINGFWNEFPTQSPLCGGNDGIPSKLDGITFSKWRNESIKAYGNAIVPQVVYQIFKTIKQYDI